MFIIEGADNLGKTTAAKQIVEKIERFPVFYSHMTRPKLNAFNFGTHYVDRMSVYGVQDRFHLGGIVYHDAIGPTALRYIEGELLVRGSYIAIFIARDEAWYRQHLESNKKDEMYGIETMVKTNQKFIELVDTHRVHFDALCEVSEHGFPGYSLIEYWCEQWKDRLRAKESRCGNK